MERQGLCWPNCNAWEETGLISMCSAILLGSRSTLQPMLDPPHLYKKIVGWPTWMTNDAGLDPSDAVKSEQRGARTGCKIVLMSGFESFNVQLYAKV